MTVSVTDSMVQSPSAGGHSNTHHNNMSRDHKQFEEVFKKSTENLFYVPASRTAEVPNSSQNAQVEEFKARQKYNMWKAQTGKVDLTSGNQTSKPPKH